MTLAQVPIRLRLDAGSQGQSMDSDDFDAVADWDRDYRYELVHGMVEVSPITSEGEAGPNDELGFLLRLYRHQHPIGSVMDETLPERHVHMRDGSRRRADRVIWVGLGRSPDPQTDVPSIVVEFVSRTNRDRRRDYEEKRIEYRGIGVKEYWIVDRFDRRMLVYHADGSEQVIGESETYATPLLPGFELPLARLMASADQWK